MPFYTSIMPYAYYASTMWTYLPHLVKVIIVGFVFKWCVFCVCVCVCVRVCVCVCVRVCCECMCMCCMWCIYVCVYVHTQWQIKGVCWVQMPKDYYFCATSALEASNYGLAKEASSFTFFCCSSASSELFFLFTMPALGYLFNQGYLKYCFYCCKTAWWQRILV